MNRLDRLQFVEIFCLTGIFLRGYLFNPPTPKSDQCQISPAASVEILHHIV